MAKAALLDVLEKTIGKYVKNLDAESLNVAVWSGKIKLNALQLDCDAVNAELSRQAAATPNLSIPFKVISGEFGSFEVDVPWAHLMSRPVILRASDLKVIVEPFNRGASADFLNALLENEATRANQIMEHRIKSLQLADEYRKQANRLRDLAVQDIADQSPGTNGFVANLVRRIIENLQFDIKNISVTLKSASCSAGLEIASLSLATTDEDGKVTFVDRSNHSTQSKSFLHKVLRITGLGAYIDDEASSALRLSSINENGKNYYELSRHSYVIKPLSFEARLRQSDSNECVEFPKYQLQSHLSSISILLSKPQLELGRQIIQKIREDTSAHPLFPEYRPLRRVTKDCVREWWKYAVRCIGRMNGRRSWIEFYLALQKRRIYIPLYKRYIHAQSCPWLVELSIYEIADLQDIEQDRTISINGIMTWRNLADAQVQLEKLKFEANRKQKNPGGLFSSLFGGTAKADESSNDAPPIHLSKSELEELEQLSAQVIEGPELSAGSKVLDLCFALKSVTICLSSRNNRSLVLFDMGTVSTKLQSMKNGSFALFLSLSSLEITDKATTNTLFPTILKNRPEEEEDAFTFEFTKSDIGDRRLVSKLNTFEIVCSPTLVLEIKRFLENESSLDDKKTNPILRQSISGSMDLFYDARFGKSLVDIPEVDPLSPSSQVVDDFSIALIQAWKTKTKTQTDWSVDLDLRAPILFIPENCIESKANVLIFDFGRAHFIYGGDVSSAKLSSWFLENKRYGNADEVASFDRGHVMVNSLAFSIGRACDCQRIVQAKETKDFQSFTTDVIQPISFSIDMGIERNADSVPRICCFGDIPSISLTLSCTQFSRTMLVVSSWKTTIQQLSSDEADDLNDDSSRASSIRSVSQIHKRSVAIASKLAEALAREVASVKGPSFIQFFCGLRLSRVSMSITAEPTHAVEAQLLSVDTSLETMSNGIYRSNLSMGWFWILDQCKGSFPRVQRLLAHSPLPLTPEECAEKGYNIIGELEKRGIFDENSSKSSELADIAFIYTPAPQENTVTSEASSIVRAKFSTLHINYNPISVAAIMEMASNFGQETGDDPLLSINDSMLVSSPRTHALEKKKPQKSTDARSTVIVAEMKGFYLSLRSARDDLPLFEGAMSSARVQINLHGAKDLTAFVSVGDLRLATPALGRTRPDYNTILGLSASECGSLLEVKFYSGTDATNRVLALEESSETYEAYAEIALSPMRLVYIQAQILALVGILGTLTKKAVCSATQAAVELAVPVALKKLFRVKAEGLEVMLPQAAHCANFLMASVGSLDVSFTALPDASSSISVALSSLMIADTDTDQMLASPVAMNVQAVIPPDSASSELDRAISVELDISTAEFLIMKPHFCQILQTLDGNISEGDLFIREGPCLLGDYADEIQLGNIDRSGEGEMVTHGGGEFVEKPRRVNLKVKVAALVLSLFKATELEPLLRLAAVDSETMLSLIPDEERKMVCVTLKDLICDDQRIESTGRKYRSLIYQPRSTSKATGDVIAVTYEAKGMNWSSVNVTIGSPRIVFIPDVLSEIVDFVTVAKTNPVDVQRSNKTMEIPGVEDVVKVDSRGDNGAIEATVIAQSTSAKNFFSLAVSTAKCSIMLVDLGSDYILHSRDSELSIEGPVSVAETIVLCGIFDAAMKQETSCSTSQPISLTMELHIDGFESYTAFGLELRSAVQILDPTQMSLYFSNMQNTYGQNIVDLRFAILSPVDVTISMGNIALVNAILTSVNDSFSKSQEEAVTAERFLTDDEMRRIINFAQALDADDSERSVSSEMPTKDEAFNSLGVPETKIFNGNQNSTSLKLTTPEIKITVVNDLQGCDEALLRLIVRNCMFQGHRQENCMTSIGSRPFDAFECSIYTSVLADYFDSSSVRWKTLLLQPWELSAKGSRGPNRNVPSSRPNTVLDIESHPCHLSFSEEFLMSLASANRMWTVYATASESAFQSLDSTSNSLTTKSLRRSLAAGAARSFVSSLPYAIENHSGLQIKLTVIGDRDLKRIIPSGCIEYFRFEPPRDKGIGGKRLYGQDVNFRRTVLLQFEQHEITMEDLDVLLGKPAQAHDVGYFVTTHVVKEGKTVVVHVSSGFDVYNNSTMPFQVSLSRHDQENEVVGVCYGSQPPSMPTKVTQLESSGRLSKTTRKFGVPVALLTEFRREWSNLKEATLLVYVTPLLSIDDQSWYLEGEVIVHANEKLLSSQKDYRVDIECKPKSKNSTNTRSVPRNLFPFHCRGIVSIRLVDGLHPSIDLILEPRALIVNDMPVPVVLKSPMPHIFSTRNNISCLDRNENCYVLDENNRIEIFTSGPSIAVDIKLRDAPVGGTATEWMEGGWIDLPLSTEFRLTEPLRCRFGAVQKVSLINGGACEFFVVEGFEQTTKLFMGSISEQSDGSIEVSASSDDAEIGTFFITVGTYAIDHSGDLLFERVLTNRGNKGIPKLNEPSSPAVPLGAYAEKYHSGRLSLLPGPKDPIRLLHLTMDGATGFRKSVPFTVEDLAICDGGFESTPILFEDGTPAGFFAYRQLVRTYQSEIHIIPEYVFFNGNSKLNAVVWQEDGSSVLIDPGKIAPFHPYNRKEIKISIQFPELGAESSSIKVDSHGLHVAILSTRQHKAIGSFAVQTVVGSRDSRWVIKIGEVKFGSFGNKLLGQKHNVLRGDFLRLRMKWSELQITLNEARPITDRSKAIVESALDNFNLVTSPQRGLRRGTSWVEARAVRTKDSITPNNIGDGNGKAICTILLHRFTVDWQRVFKEESATSINTIESSQRAQLSVVIHNVRIKDENPSSVYPIVFDSTSQRASFFDLCIRTRGDIDADLVKIDLIDIKLSHTHGTSEKVFISTSEDFVWSVLDLADRIVVAAAEFGGVDIQIQWDKEHGGYVVAMKEKDVRQTNRNAMTYVPPKTDKIYNIRKTRISPFKLVVSFNRSPQSSRYEVMNGVRGANIMNYFSRQLKFKVEKAELKFSRYEVNDVKGPPDRIVELLKTVYISKIKTKILSILTAASFQDWKYLASRQDGNDDYVEGDYLRATGNIAGASVNYVLKHTGNGVGEGLSLVAHTIGDGIESATSAIGIRPLGAGVNSLVSGVGDGVGDTIAGVGRGTGKIIKGTGQGVGKCVGGVAGGALQMGKAVGKGIVSGDVNVMASGIARGAQSMGTGVGEGVESIVTGVSDGVLSVGQGLFSGVKHLGRGIGGAVMGKKTTKKPKKKQQGG